MGEELGLLPENIQKKDPGPDFQTTASNYYIGGNILLQAKMVWHRWHRHREYRHKQPCLKNINVLLFFYVCRSLIFHRCRLNKYLFHWVCLAVVALLILPLIRNHVLTFFLKLRAASYSRFLYFYVFVLQKSKLVCMVIRQSYKTVFHAIYCLWGWNYFQSCTVRNVSYCRRKFEPYCLIIQGWRKDWKSGWASSNVAPLRFRHPWISYQRNEISAAGL